MSEAEALVRPTRSPPSIPRAAGVWHQVRALAEANVAPAYSVVLALIFAGALVVAWAVLPGEDERIEALERDGQTKRAFTMLEARFNRGDHRQRTLVSLRRLYDYYGDAAKSKSMLTLLAAQNPRDLFIQRQLAQLARLNQDLPGQIHALQAQLAIRYSEPVCQRLTGLLHLSSDYAAEQAALIACHESGYRRPEGLERLASLYAAQGKLQQSAEILAAVDDRRWLRGSHERLLLFDALMAANQPREALRRGIRWYKGQPEQDLALEMIARLITSNQNDLALQFAREVGAPGDAVSLAAAEILVDQVQYVAARSFLAGWLKQAAQMSTETALRFVSAAIDAEDPNLALQGAEQLGLDRFQGTDLLPLAEALMVTGQTAAFEVVRARLTPEIVRSDALLSAAIDVREGRLEQARATLAGITLDPDDERRQAFKDHLVALAGRPTNIPRLVREPAETQIQLAPPLVTISPSAAQTRKLNAPVEVARRVKRFARRRLILRRAATPPPPAKKIFAPTFSDP